MRTVSYGRVRIDFDSSDHSYTVTVGGEAAFDLTSVTTFLKVISKDDALMAWQFRVTVEGMVRLLEKGITPKSTSHAVALMQEHGLRGEDYKKYKGVIGTNIHSALGGYAADAPPALDEVLEHERVYLRGLTGWILERRPRFFASEIPVVSLTHGYAGTFDYLRWCEEPGCECAGKGLVLGDAKTSKEIWDEAHFQVAAYVAAYLELVPDAVICGGEVLHLNRGGGFEVEWCVGELEDFLAARNLHAKLNRVRVARRQQRRCFKGHETMVQDGR